MILLRRWNQPKFLCYRLHAFGKILKNPSSDSSVEFELKKGFFLPSSASRISSEAVKRRQFGISGTQGSN